MGCAWRQFLYNGVKEKSESSRKAIDTLRRRKGNNAIKPKSDNSFT